MKTVLHQLGEQWSARFASTVPDLTYVAVPVAEPPPDGVRGDALIAMTGARREMPILDRLDELGVEWVHAIGTGMDAYPIDRLRGRLVTCGRGASAVPISEYVLASMLAFEKQFPSLWLEEPPDHWAFAPLGSLTGKTLGLIGLGGIGAAVARRALAFDMRVVATRRHPGAPSPVAGVEVVASLDELLPVADHLVVAAPATARTQHLLDTRAFALLKPGAHLVNIARGTLVDQDALRQALDTDVVALASLDVCDPEPLPAAHWLYDHPRVHLTAHVSWSSPQMLDTLFDMVVENLRRYAAGEPLEGVVDLDEGY